MFSRISNNGGGNRKGNTTNTAIDSSPTNKWLFVQTRNQPAQQNGPQNINHHLHSPPPTHPQQHWELSNSPIVGMSISSSFDVISGGGSILSDNTITNSSPLPPTQTPPNPFIAHFEELNRLPIGHWLKKGGGVGTNQQQNATPKNIVQTTIIPDLATMLREIQLREDEEQRSSSPQQHHQQRKRVANGEEQKMASPVDLDGKGWLKSDAATAMWSSPSCAAVITGILASSLEDWLAQPPAAKIARRQHNQQQKQSPTTTMMMGMGHQQQQEKLWAPSWATTATFPAGNCNEEEEENGFTATVHHQNGVGHRRRTETANSSISSSLYSSLYYNYRFGNEKEAEVDEEPRNHGQHHRQHDIADELLPMLSQVKSLRTGLEELEEKLKGMLLMEGGGENNAADGTATIVANEEEYEEQMVDKIEEEKTKTANDGQEDNYFLEPPVFSSASLLDGPSPPLLELPSDRAHWLKKYPPPKPKRPMNEMAEDLSCWESVLGWKGILEKIHASGEHVWLAPSSRALKG